MNKKIKEAFSKVKKDIFSLGQEVNELKTTLLDLKQNISYLSNSLHKIHQNLFFSEQNNQKDQKFPLKQTSTPTETNPTLQHITPTHLQTPTHKHHLEALKSQNMSFSTGNEGVPTDRQTDRQTDRHIISTQNNYEIYENNQKNDFFKISEILDNLDDVKKEIRRKFKNLTNKEMDVFSLLYNLEEEGVFVSYKILAEHLNLSESSVRDYIGRIIKKGIPITKEKLNNKQILLSISKDLTKIASLNTIMQLREL